MDNKNEKSDKIIEVNLFATPALGRGNSFVIGPSGKGRSYYYDFLRTQFPGLKIVEVDLNSDYKDMPPAEPIRFTLMNKELTPEILEDAVNVLTDCTGVLLTPEQLLTLIDKDPSLCFSMLLNGVHDTEVRGDLAGCLSTHLVGRLWPTYGENIDMESFDTRLKEAAIEKGYQVVSSNG